MLARGYAMTGHRLASSSLYCNKDLPELDIFQIFSFDNNDFEITDRFKPLTMEDC